MKKYDFEKMGKLWADEARKITESGVFVAHSGNWDLWEYGGIIYSIPVSGSGADVSIWCGLSSLRSHLFHLRQVIGYDTLIPTGWENVNFDFLAAYGVV